MNERIRSLPLGAGLMAGLVVALGIVIFRPSVAAAQPPGPPIPAGPCGALQMADFSAIPDAPTTIFSTQIVSATADQPEYCDVLGMISSQIQFELWLPHDLERSLPPDRLRRLLWQPGAVGAVHLGPRPELRSGLG